MILNDVNHIINENFDLMDKSTRKCLAMLEDSEQTQMLSALSSALYDKIVDKVDEIDFGSIPRSRGDITKVDGFANTEECLRIMRQLVLEYRQDPTVVENVQEAIQNVKDRKTLFMKAYALNIEFPMVLYNLIVASIENSVSFLISVCIQYIKDPETDGMAAAVDKVAYNNAKSNMLYEQLLSFNAACRSGDLDNSLNAIMKGGQKVKEACEAEMDFATGYESCDKAEQTELFAGPSDHIVKEVEPEDNVEINPFIVTPGDDIPGSPEEPIMGGAMREFGLETIAVGLAATAGAGLIVLKGYKFLIAVLIPTMRNIAYYLINLKMSIKGYLELQADFIEMNAYKLQGSERYERDQAKMAKVVKKQLSIAKKLKAISNKIAIGDKTAEKKAIAAIGQDQKKYKVEDLKNEIPSEIYNKSVIF